MISIKNHFGIVILAGGESSRLGSPKQLLVYRNKTLLRHAVLTALEANCGPVMVVTGANFSAVEKELIELPVEIVHNNDWQEGMASTLRKGLSAMLLNHPETDGIIFMVCDQPFVTKSHLLCLIDRHRQKGKPIAASCYNGQAGTPAFFHQSYFKRLMELKGDKGARTLIAGQPEDVERVEFEQGAIDIDTKEDYERLLKV